MQSTVFWSMQQVAYAAQLIDYIQEHFPDRPTQVIVRRIERSHEPVNGRH